MSSSSIPATEIEKESTAADLPNWLELPRDVTPNILQRLSTIEIVTIACQVCPYWWNICKDPHMWRIIHMTDLHYSHHNSGDNLVKICCYAIARSCGQLEDLDIEYFGTDDLLALVSHCSSQIKRMRLVECDGFSNKGFSEAVKKFSLLEELDISFNKYLSRDSLEVVGRFCPHLKSLKYKQFGLENGVAFAVANTMPGLYHLKFYGVILTHAEILAILDGCPLLESLDMGSCYYHSFASTESLEKRCREQIKHLVLPSPPDYNSFSDDDDDDDDDDYDDFYWENSSENSY